MALRKSQELQGQKHSLNAAQFIAKAAAEHPGQVTVLALGPLTNIALAFKVNPDVDKLLVRHAMDCASEFHDLHVASELNNKKASSGKLWFSSPILHLLSSKFLASIACTLLLLKKHMNFRAGPSKS